MTDDRKLTHLGWYVCNCGKAGVAWGASDLPTVPLACDRSCGRPRWADPFHEAEARAIEGAPRADRA